jgi:phage terminase large subunit-like protein
MPRGYHLLENRRMSRIWWLLQLDLNEPPSISISDREDVTKISDWSAARVKAEKFEEIEFDKLVTNETMRRFLGYKIPKNKKTVTKRGATKKKSDAPRSLRQAAKKRTLDPAVVIP